MLPPLLVPRELRVVLPAYQVLMLERLAERRARPVESYLSGYLLDLASVEAGTLEREIPGFNAALRFPDRA